MPPKPKQRKDAVQRKPELRDAVIQAGDNVLVQLPNGDIRSVKVDPNSCASRSFSYANHLPNFRTATINKFGSFHANELIDQSYGITYEIQGKKLKALPPRTLQEVGRNHLDLGLQLL